MEGLERNVLYLDFVIGGGLRSKAVVVVVADDWFTRTVLGVVLVAERLAVVLTLWLAVAAWARAVLALAAAGLAVEHDHVFSDDFCRVALLAGGLVDPIAGLEASFDVDL